MSIVAGHRYGERVVMGRKAGMKARRAATPIRRAQMAAMQMNDCNNTEIAAYFKCTVRHVRREIAAYRKERGYAPRLRARQLLPDDGSGRGRTA